MSTAVNCPQCGAVLKFRGVPGAGTKPCPNCGSPLTFGTDGELRRPEPYRPASSPTPAGVAAAPIRIERPREAPQPDRPEPYRPAPKPQPQPAVPEAVAPVRPASKGLNPLIPLGIAGGVVAMALFGCVGVTILMIAIGGSSSGTAYEPTPDPVYSGETYTPQTVYSPPAYEPDPAPYVDTTYSTPAYDSTATYDPPVQGLWNFDSSGRIAELELAIQQDEAKLSELDGQLLLTGGFGIVSGIVSEMGETTDDRISGEIGEQGANFVYSQLQIERNAVAARLDANRAELNRLLASP